MRKKSAGSNTEQQLFLTPGVRALLFCIGLFLALQAVFVVIFIAQDISGLDSVFNKLLGAWAGFSALAGFWLVIKASQGSDSHNLTEPIKRSALLGQTDSNLTLASLCSHMQEGMALLQDEKIIYANSTLAYLLGMQEEDLIDTSVRRYIHPEDISLLDLNEKNKVRPINTMPGEGARGTMHSSGYAAFSAGASNVFGGLLGAAAGISEFTGPNRSTMRMTTSLGDYRWVICNVHFMIWDDQEVTLMLFENIGPLKQAQHALEEHEQQSRIFLERAPLGVAMFDALGQLKLANTTWHSIWSNVAGAAPKHFNVLQDQFLPQATVEQAVRLAFNKKEAGINSLEHCTPWGETRWFNINFHPMLTPVGNLVGVIMIQQDITDQVRSMRRENELNEQLMLMRRELVELREQAAKQTD